MWRQVIEDKPDPGFGHLHVQLDELTSSEVEEVKGHSFTQLDSRGRSDHSREMESYCGQTMRGQQWRKRWKEAGGGSSGQLREGAVANRGECRPSPLQPWPLAKVVRGQLS